MLHHPNIDPVALHLGPLKIHWYGLMYLGGFLFAYWICRRHANLGRTPLKAEQVEDAIFWSAMGVILGGRVGYVFFYGWSGFIADPLWLFKVWDGGMSFHGGFIGVLVAAFFYAKKYKISLGAYLDTLALATPIGLGLGRLGNFIGQELWGRPTDLPWGVVFPRDITGLARHPSQLYQAALEGLALFVILYLYSRKPKPEWGTGALFLIGYGSFRFLVEFVRQPDAHIGFDLFGWMSRGQLLSIPMVMSGIILMIWAYRQPQK
jgi:phosphatidylglycerol:prolipoprotein diacylglycerol transferase